jgi:hypothetical protein
MEMAERADLAKLRGDVEAARGLLAEAFEIERKAALTLEDKHEFEPTRSVLFRSAASLAIECGKFPEGETMIFKALSGSPPPEIAEELKDLLDKASFERHLARRGIKLDPNEFQLSIWGPFVGRGIARPKEFIERIQKLEILVFRTLERRLGRDFRESGRPERDISDAVEVYVSVPRAASFAVSFKLGRGQMALPGIDLGADVVGEMMQCFDLINSQRMDDLRTKIPNDTYYENFVGLAKCIAPDGERVSSVALIAQKGDKEQRIVLRTPRQKFFPPSDESRIPSHERVEIRGLLRYADATKKDSGIIELVAEGGAIQKVKVPLHMMADIVRPMFDYEVEVVGERKGQYVMLESIEPTTD